MTGWARVWGGVSGQPAHRAPRRVSPRRVLPRRVARSAQLAALALRPVLGFVWGRGLVVLVVLGVLSTVSVIWSGTDTDTAGSVTSGAADPGVSPLTVAPQRGATGQQTTAQLSGLADIAVWVQPGATESVGALGALSGLAAMSHPLPAPGPTSVAGMLTRVLAVAAQLAGGLGLPEWSGSRIGPQRPQAGAGLTLWAALILTCAVLVALARADFADPRCRRWGGFTSVLERPG